MDKKPGPGAITIDERFISQWVNWGMNDFAVYLTNQAAFEVWCRTHARIGDAVADANYNAGQGA